MLHVTREACTALARLRRNCSAVQRLLSRSLGGLHTKCDPPARPMRVIASDQPPFTSATRDRPRQTPALQPTVCCLARLCLSRWLTASHSFPAEQDCAHERDGSHTQPSAVRSLMPLLTVHRRPPLRSHAAAHRFTNTAVCT
jgi:hypothetical protein